MFDCKITSLSEEMIAIILSYNDITMEDIINFRCVCKQFRYAAKYDKFLEKKLSQRWPYAKRRYEILKKAKKGGGFINFVTTGINSTTQLRNYLSQILFFDYYYNNRSIQNYFKGSIDYVVVLNNYIMKFMNNIDKYVNSPQQNGLIPIHISETAYNRITEMKHIFYIDELKYMFTRGIDRKSIERDCNIKTSHYLKLFSIRNEFDRYKEKPEREQLLEETCTFVAKHIQVRKDVCYTNVSALLDTIAQEVLKCLGKKHPNHSIFSTSEEIVSSWKTNNIEDNYLDETESTQIMDTLEEYIFSTLNFRTRSSSPVDIKYLCIDYVLQSKYGHKIIVFTIFQSVARRLGLRCDLIDVDNKICIFWKPKFLTKNLENARCFSIKNEIFPNCLIDHISEYRMQTCYCNLAITTKKMLLIIRNCFGQFIMEHEITALRLVEVQCDVYRQHTAHFTYNICNCKNIELCESLLVNNYV